MIMFRLIALAAALTVCSSIAFAQSSNPAWLEDLGFEMERLKDCEVAYYLRIKEDELGGQPTYEARVQCVDGRQFDAIRIGDDAEYDIKECDIQAC
jgi:hypothetical protein